MNTNGIIKNIEYMRDCFPYITKERKEYYDRKKRN